MWGRPPGRASTCCSGWPLRRRRRGSAAWCRVPRHRRRTVAGSRAGGRPARSWSRGIVGKGGPPSRHRELHYTRGMLPGYHVAEFTPAERSLLEHHVTSVDGPVFALQNLPQTTAAALFARYSRSSKSLRRLLIDEFATELDEGAAEAS